MNKKIWLAGALGLGLMLMNRTSKAATPSKAFSPTKNASITGFPLRFGSRGEKVKKLQSALMTAGRKESRWDVFSTGGSDGIFGKGTLSAVQREFNTPELSYQQYQYLLKKAGINHE